MLHPRAIQLIMDSLRHWVLEMHVDGFRFDLAPVLARELYEVNRLGTFFDIIQQDPVLSQVKLIAEPWDVGPGGYQVGNFPVGLGRVERQVPRLRAEVLARRPRTAPGARLPALRLQRPVRGERPQHVRVRQLRDGARRLHAAGPRDVRGEAQRGRTATRTRTGPTRTSPPTGASRARPTSPTIVEIRQRMKRNLIATLVFSQGVRMLLGGDEIGRSQQREQQRLLPGQRAELVRLGAPRPGHAPVHAGDA